MSSPTVRSSRGEPISAGALCAECASIGYTCCQPEYGVSLTFHDARRLMDATGGDPRKMFRLRRIKDKELLEGLRVDPVFRMAFIGKDRLLQTMQGKVMEGRAMSEHDCYFLGPEGCRVFEDRPRLCHLHPFWYKLEKRAKALEKGLKRPARIKARLAGKMSFFYDAIDDTEEAEEADCLVVNRMWPELADGLASIGEDEATLAHHGEAMTREILWQRARVKELAETMKLSKVRLEDLIPLIEQAPLDRFEV